MKNRFNSTNKFHAVKHACKQYDPKNPNAKCTKLHDSKAEAKRCDQLALLESANKLTYESQVRYDLVIDGWLICWHNVDFRIHKDGKTWVEDVKGMCMPYWKIKYKQFRALYPDIEYVVNFNGNFGKGKIPPMKKAKPKTPKQEELF